MDKILKVHNEAMATFRKQNVQFKLDNEMLSFLIINGFFFTVLLFLQLIWTFFVDYTTFVGWYCFFSGLGVFLVFLKPIQKSAVALGIFTNFDGSISYKPRHVYHPKNVDELVEIIKNADNHKIRVFGSGSSFNAIGRSTDSVIVLDNFNEILEINANSNTVKVQAGVRLGELAVALWAKGLQLPSLGWFSPRTVGGAISTSTHTSSLNHSSLASRVVSLDLVTGNGDLLTVSSDDVFDAVRSGLGLLGVVTSVTFAVDTASNMKKTTQVVSLEEALNDMQGRASSNAFFGFSWIPHVNKAEMVIVNETREQVKEVVQWQAQMVQVAQKNAFDAYHKILFFVSGVVEPLTPYLLGFYANSLKRKETIVKSYEALFADVHVPHWNEVEYFVPVKDARAAINELQSSIKSGGWIVNVPVRVSFVKGDKLWISEAFGEDRVSIAIGMYNKPLKWRQFVAKVDGIMKHYNGRPNWAKDSTLKKEDLAALYPRFNDFLEVKKRLDSRGIFTNEHLAAIFD